MPLVVNKDNMRKEILLAFEQCIKDKPLNKITMRDIAAKANVSHAKVLYYFGSKQKLLLAYIDEFTEIHIQFIQTWLQEHKKECSRLSHPRSCIGWLFRDIFSFDQNNNYYNTFIQIYTMTPYDDKIKSTVRKAYATWKNAIHQFLTELYGKDMESTSEALYILIEGILLYSTYYELSDTRIETILDSLSKL
ncbi:TetR/AcrR family transcriptional regulator [Paenibacillus lentus]|uniref:TetR/AcrR family transcriptional regulator n=1 Tax=Paenibacillus lentus TaxID=1338368 RepID=UPI0036560A0A